MRKKYFVRNISEGWVIAARYGDDGGLMLGGYRAHTSRMMNILIRFFHVDPDEVNVCRVGCRVQLKTGAVSCLRWEEGLDELREEYSLIETRSFGRLSR